MPRTSRKTVWRIGAGFLVLGVVAGLWPVVRSDARAIVLIGRMTGRSLTGVPAFLGNYPLRETDGFFLTEGRKVPFRRYAPIGLDDPPAVVMLHGMHWDGYTDERLVILARAFATSGITVMTPLLEGMTDFRLDLADVETIGAAVVALQREVGGKRIGLMGGCFGGGLCLVVAADPRYAERISFVATIGAHADLVRVCRFYLTGRIERVDGKSIELHPDPYGKTIVLYEYPADFFGAEEADKARQALGAWLRATPDQARNLAKTLSPPNRSRIEAVFVGDFSPFNNDFLRVFDREKPLLDRLSPLRTVGDIRAPMFILHGEADTVVPASEAGWIAARLSPTCSSRVLASRVVSHVDLGQPPTFGEKLAFLRFLSALLDSANRS